MTTHSRRAFFTTTAGMAAGAALIGSQRGAGASSLADVLAPTSGSASSPVAAVDTAAAANAVLYVRDAASGTVVIMSGDHERVVVDPTLVAAIAGAGGK